MISCPNVKVNLGLSVLRRRPDGYHDLETLFVPFFGLHDTLEIITGDDYSRTSAGIFSRYSAGSGCCPAGVSSITDSCARLAQAISDDAKVMVTIARAEGVDWDPLKDLTAKAYRILDADFNLPPVKIFLEKTSPVGAGLGGGSADAAFALRMLNELFSLNLDDTTLAAYAARLGSDCAFFIYNRPMLGTGRGEVLEPYSMTGIDFSGCREDGAASYDLKVIVPEGIGVSTADAYRGITPREASGTVLCPLMEALSLSVPEWKDSLVNDFETTVFAKFPELAEMKRRLYAEGAVYASMSGSGSALFGLFRR